MQLYNKLSSEERSRMIEIAGKERLILSFYQYADIGNPEIFRNNIFIEWNSLNVLGRIYIAKEWINAQLSLPAENFELFKANIDSISFLNGVRLNIAIEHNNKSFLKLKIKVKDKIVSDGINDPSFDITKIGKHVNAIQFNKLLDDTNTICVDMRNHYESEIGFFEGAIKPNVDTFRESLEIINNELEKNGSEKNYLMDQSNPYNDIN